MKKIAIFTLNGYFNYGNRLQNYAVKEILHSFGFFAETAVVKVENQENLSKYDKIKRKIGRTLKRSPSELRTLLKTKLYTLETEKAYVRANNFKEFTHEYLRERKYTITNLSDVHALESEYDFFVTGSDQVWNPHYLNDEIFFCLLPFAQKEKFSFSASFGISVEEFFKIPPSTIDVYTKNLSEMSSISVREDEGAKIVNILTGRKAEVLVDPTMLLTKEEWIAVARKPKFLEKRIENKKGYILGYFLGEISARQKKAIRDLARQNNLCIIMLSPKDKIAYSCGPAEFIDLISSANLVITDSFHGAVFSILMETPFVVFDRSDISNMNSRLATLLAKFEMEHRKIKKERRGDLTKNIEVFNMDFSQVEEILRKERAKAEDFLQKALQQQTGE